MDEKGRRLPASFSTRRKALKALCAAAAFGMLPQTRAAKGETLFLYNWDDYMSDETLDGFSAQSGSPVQMDLFADNEELFAKLRLSDSGYDLAIPSHDFVDRMWRNNLITPLDHSKLPNLANLGLLHQNPSYDPNNKHSVPYMWGYMGLAYRKSAIARPTSWKDVFTVEGLQKNGNVAWQSEASSTFAAAAMMMGKSANDYSAATQSLVFEKLSEAKNHLTAIAPDNGQDMLAAGEVDIAVEWNGDVAALIEEDPDIGFVLPDEGSLYFVDCMIIPKAAPHFDLAHEFINHVLDPQVGSKLAEYIGYATPNQAAYLLTSQKYRDNEVIFPKADAHLETPNYPGEDALTRLYSNWEAMLVG